MFGLIGLGLLVFGGGAIVIRVADDHGHNGIVWGLASMIGSALALWAGWRFLAHQTTEVSEVGFGSVALVIGVSVGVHVGLAVVAAQTPPGPLKTRASSWPMAWLGQDDSNCELVLEDNAVKIVGESLYETITFADLIEVRPDGECVKVRWRDGDDERDALLRPMKGPGNRAARVRLATAIAKRVEAQRRSAA